MGVLKLLESLLDGWLLVGWQLVAMVLQEVLGGDDEIVGLGVLVDALALCLVGSGVLLCLSLHAVDLLLAQA